MVMNDGIIKIEFYPQSIILGGRVTDDKVKTHNITGKITTISLSFSRSLFFFIRIDVFSHLY
jgi:hypothetical protein